MNPMQTLHPQIPVTKLVPSRIEPQSLEVWLLDGFELRCDGAVVGVPTSAQRLLSLLALRDRALLRGQVAGILWPDSSDAHAAASLRSALWRLRRLAFGIVEVTGHHLRLAPTVGVDVRRLAWRASDLAAGVPARPEDVRWIAGAGDLLPGWDEDWLITERERLRQLRLDTLESMTRQLAGLGMYAQAVEAGLAAVAGEPFRESAHRCLIEAHLAQGNVAEAIRRYQAYRDLMRAELLLEPSSHMEKLLERLMPVARGASGAGLATTLTTG
jgi:DNA-binding SARP family transcriptional activator